MTKPTFEQFQDYNTWLQTQPLLPKKSVTWSPSLNDNAASGKANATGVDQGAGVSRAGVSERELHLEAQLATLDRKMKRLEDLERNSERSGTSLLKAVGQFLVAMAVRILAGLIVGLAFRICLEVAWWRLALTGVLVSMGLWAMVEAPNPWN